MAAAIWILLYTDSPVFGLGLESVFEGSPERVWTVACPDRCFRILNAIIPHVVLVDHDSEGSSRVCEEIGTPWPAVPLFGVATLPRDTIRRTALDLGVR